MKTRMHSSRMRTGRSLTVCCNLLPGGVWSQGVWSWGGLVLEGSGLGGSAPGGVWSQGGLVWGVCSEGAVPGGGGALLGGGGSGPGVVVYPSMY